MNMSHPHRSAVSTHMSEHGEIALVRSPSVRRLARWEMQEAAWYHEERANGVLVWQELRYDGDSLAAELADLALSGWGVVAVEAT